MTLPYINPGSPYSKPAHKPRTVAVRMVAAIAFFFTGSLCLAQSDLIRLIPPGTPVLAGLRRTPPGQGDDFLWLATKHNTADLKQFVSVTAGDPDRHFDQVIVAGSASDTDSLGSHLLLAKGKFNFAEISTTALGTGAIKSSYKDVPVLILEALAIESRGPRWLAVPQPDVALLGSPSAVESALDRYLSRAPRDPLILQRLRNIPEHDAAWSSIILDSRQVESHLNLHGDADVIYPCLRHARELVLGIRPGSDVKIELRTASDSNQDADASLGCLRTALFRNSTPSVRISFTGGNQHALLATLSREGYDRWLNGFRKSMMNQMLEAMIPAPEEDGRNSTLVPGNSGAVSTH
jgi:hypothetical protein